MKWFGSISELVSIVFRKNSQAITIRPNQATTYTASRDIQTPAQDAASILVSRDSTDTLSNKSISGAANTLTNIPAGTALTGQVPTANGGTGVNSTATFPTSGVVVTEAGTQALTNKTLDGDLNTVQDLPDTALKTNLTNASKFFTRDASGIPESATKAVPAGVVVGTTDTQTLTNKTLTSPVINTPTGIVKGDVGLGNVDNTSDATKNSATATLTNKTLTGAIVSDYLELDTQGSDPSAPAGAGDVRVYAKDKFLYTRDSDGTVTQVGAGSGGRNYLAQDFFGNSVGTVGDGNVSDTGNRSTGTMSAWQTTASANINITSSTSSPLRETGSFLTTGSGNAAAGTTFIESKGFNLDNVDLGQPLSIVFDVSGSTLSTDWDICVVRYNSSGTFQEKIPVAGTASTGTPASALIPTGTTTFRGFFIPSSTQTDYYALRWRRLANSVNIKLDSLQVSPFSYQVGFAGTDWQSYTPTISNMGTTSSLSASWRRVGDSMDVYVSFTSGTHAGALGSVTLPSGYSINTSYIPAATATHNGQGYQVGYYCTDQVATGLGNMGSVLAGTTTSASTVYIGGGAAVATASITSDRFVNVSNMTSNTHWVLRFSVPIAQWSTNIQLADRAVEEYSFNTSTSTSASDTTSFGYGSQGAQIQSITAGLSRRVRFTTPILATDSIVLELSSDRLKWVSVSGGGVELAGTQVAAWSFQGSAYGVGKTSIINTTDVDIFFGTYRLPTSSYGGTGSPWSDVGSYYWRVRKVSGGAAVGFPVAASNVVGATDGSTAGTGYLGQVLEQAITSERVTTTATTFVDSTETLTLTPGSWRIEYTTSQRLVAGSSFTGAASGMTYLTTSGNTILHTSGNRFPITAGSQNYTFQNYGYAYVNISSDTTYKLRIQANGGNGSGGYEYFLLANGNGALFSSDGVSYLRAVRIR